VVLTLLAIPQAAFCLAAEHAFLPAAPAPAGHLLALPLRMKIMRNLHFPQFTILRLRVAYVFSPECLPQAVRLLHFLR
jgi:hypothetical protein